MPQHNKPNEKQLAKFKRQKCISLMEKLLKNLFRMFRDETVEIETVRQRFATIKQKIDGLGDVPLHSEYNRAMKKYIDTLDDTLTEISGLDAITRQHQLTQLNRIQKIKNTTSYKKKKYQDTY